MAFRNMQRAASVALCTCFFSATAFSQTTSDPAASVAPFTGHIGYKISYMGYTEPYLAALPDSMTIWVNPPLMRVTYHGKLADTLGLTLHWDASQMSMMLIDRPASTAWLIDEHAPAVKKPVTKTVRKDSVAGQPCAVVELALKEGKETYWFADGLRFPINWAAFNGDSITMHVPPFIWAGEQRLPLAFTRSTKVGKLTQTVNTTAVTIAPGTPPMETFRMPSGYDVKPFDPLVRFHPLVPKPVLPE